MSSRDRNSLLGKKGEVEDEVEDSRDRNNVQRKKKEEKERE